MAEDSSRLTRRDFLKGIALGAGTIALGLQVPIDRKTKETEPQLTGILLVEKEENGKTSLVARDAQTGIEIEVIDAGTEGAIFEHVTPSPDGERVAYLADNQIYAKNHQNQVVKVYNFKTHSFEGEGYVAVPGTNHISWSSDGKRLAYDGSFNINNESKATVMIVDVEQKSRQALEFDQGIQSPDFHPTDPNLMAVSSQIGDRKSIVLDISQSKPQIKGSSDGWDPRWLSDGSIVCTTPNPNNDPNNVAALKRYDYKTGETITNLPYQSGFTISPDKNTIVLLREEKSTAKVLADAYRDVSGKITGNKAPRGGSDTTTNLYRYDIHSGQTIPLLMPKQIEVPELDTVWVNNEWFIISEVAMDTHFRMHISGKWNHDLGADNVVGYIPPKK